MNYMYIDQLVKNKLVNGIPQLKFVKESLRAGCEKGKMKKATHRPKPEQGSKRPLSLLHMDLCGPMKVQSLSGKKYVLVIVDDFSRYNWVKILKSKDETSGQIISFTKTIQVSLQLTIHSVRTDKGTKFINNILRSFYESLWYYSNVFRC